MSFTTITQGRFDDFLGRRLFFPIVQFLCRRFGDNFKVARFFLYVNALTMAIFAVATLYLLGVLVTAINTGFTYIYWRRTREMEMLSGRIEDGVIPIDLYQLAKSAIFHRRWNIIWMVVLGAIFLGSGTIFAVLYFGSLVTFSYALTCFSKGPKAKSRARLRVRALFRHPAPITARI